LNTSISRTFYLSSNLAVWGSLKEPNTPVISPINPIVNPNPEEPSKANTTITPNRVK